MGKVLVCYFSRADENYSVGKVEVGNTEIFAKNIIEKLKADGREVDEFKIVPVVPYPEGYDDCVAKATEERTMQERPEYQGDVNLDDYSTIFFGYPIWWGDMPMIVYNFLEKHTFNGQNLYPFCTHEGSGESGTFTTVGNLAVGAMRQEGLAIGASWRVRMAAKNRPSTLPIRQRFNEKEYRFYPKSTNSPSWATRRKGARKFSGGF